ILTTLRRNWVSRASGVLSANLMVMGQTAPVWGASTSRAGLPPNLPTIRVTDVSRDRPRPSEELADTIATSSPAGAREVRATAGDRTVKGRGGSAKFELSINDYPASLGRAFLVYDLSGLSS